MAKEVVGDGMNYTPALWQAQWGNTAGTGHNHEGLDADGSCPKIVIEDDVDGYAEGTVSGEVVSTYFTTPVQADIDYVKIGSVVTLVIPEFLGQHGSNEEIQISPEVGDWPALIIPSTAQEIPIVCQRAASPDLKRAGSIIVPASVSTNFICAITGISTEMGTILTDEFGTGATKGIMRQSISYIID